MFIKLINNIKCLNFIKIIFWFYICFIGFIFVFLIPPFQKPDEVYHYYHAYSSAYGKCVSIGENGYMSVPADVYHFPEKLNAEGIAHSSQTKFPKSLLKIKYISSSKEEIIFNRSCVKFGLIAYFPNIVGIRLGGNNLLLGFYLSRFCAFLLFLISLNISIRLTGKYSPLIIAFSIIPMVIHQVTGITYDSFHISLGLLCFSFFIYLKSNSAKVKLFYLFLFYLLILFFILAKGGYFLLLVLPVLLPTYRFFKKNNINYFIKIIFLVIYFFISFLLIKNSVGYVDETQGGLINAVIQKKIILNDPFYFINVLKNTSYERFYFYWISFLGNFGWLDYEAHFSICLSVCLGICLIISSIKFPRNSKKHVLVSDILEIVFVFGIAFGTYVIIQTSLYLMWTPLAAKIIDGVQGRYLFIPFLFLMYGLVRLVEILGTRKSKELLWFIFICVVLINIVKVVYLRCYDYSRLYSNTNELIFNHKQKNDVDEYVPIVDSKWCEDVGNDKIGGFAVYLKNELRDGEYINDVYKYEVSDMGSVLYSGYLNQVEIQKNGLYIENFDKILKSHNGGPICLRLYKKYIQNNSRNGDLLLLNRGGIGSQFLRISK